MNVLITGGTGFFGASLTKRLANHGESNIVLYEKHINEDRIEDLRDKATIVQGDVLDFDKLKSTLEQHKIDRIAHLAFLLTVASASNPTLATQINCTGTVNVFESAKQCGISRIVYASSVAVYGSRKTASDQELNETACAEPDTLYGAAKLYNDHMASIYTKNYGMNMLGFRPVVVFGPSRVNLMTENPANYMNLPELAANGFPALMPPDDQEMDMVYVKDVALAWHLGLKAPIEGHHIFNLSSERRTMGEYKRLVQDLEPRSQIKTLERPIGSLRLVSNDKIVDELGFIPEHKLEDWVPEYLTYARNHL